MKSNLTHLRQQLNFWGGAPCTISREQPGTSSAHSLSSRQFQHTERRPDHQAEQVVREKLEHRHNWPALKCIQTWSFPSWLSPSLRQTSLPNQTIMDGRELLPILSLMWMDVDPSTARCWAYSGCWVVMTDTLYLSGVLCHWTLICYMFWRLWYCCFCPMGVWFWFFLMLVAVALRFSLYKMPHVHSLFIFIVKGSILLKKHNKSWPQIPLECQTYFKNDCNFLKLNGSYP